MTALTTLIHEPAQASRVPLADVPILLAQVVAEQAKLGALEGALVLRLVTASAESGPGDPATSVMLSVADAAKRANLSPAYFYEHADRLPFIRRVGRRVLVHETSFRRWLDRGSPIK